MMHRTSALVLFIVAGFAFSQAPEPIAVPPRVTDAAGDPLPEGAVTRMGTLRWRHSGPVHFVGFISDGHELISAGLDGYIRVWEVSTGRELRRWQWYEPTVGDENGFDTTVAPIRSIVLSPDRRLLAASMPDGRVQVWNLKGGEEHVLGDKRGGLFHGSNGIAFAPNGKTLATRGPDHIVRLWDLRTSKELGKHDPPEKAGQRGNISFYGCMGNTMAYAPDGKMLAVMNSWNNESSKGVVTLYDVESGKELRRIEGGERSLSGRLAFGPGTLAVAWGNRETRLYNPDTGVELRQIGEPQEGNIIHAVAFSPDGKTLATRSARSAPSIRLWDVATGKMLRAVGEGAVSEQDNIFLRLNGPGSSSLPVDFAPDGKRVADATGGRVVRVWNAE